MAPALMVREFVQTPIVISNCPLHPPGFHGRCSLANLVDKGML
jgi:hypothetical protein